MPESIASTGAPACVGSRAVFSLHPAVLRSVHPGSRPGAGGPTGGRNPGSGTGPHRCRDDESGSEFEGHRAAGVGYDTVDVPEASRRGIPVVYTPGAMAWAVAEHTLSLMLAAAKNLPHWRRVLLEGEWKDRYRRRNLDLRGATVGIVGYGRIGRQVRRLLAPFDCRVLVNGPNLTPGEMTDDGVEAVPLLELLGRSDIVTLHPPLNRETRGLINSENIGSFKPGSILVNLGRGALVESHDLLFEALETGRLQAVALDVFLDEPPDRSHPLFRHPGAVLTPHVGSATLGAQRGVLETVAGDMMAVLEGRRPTEDNLVNPEVLDRMRQEK